MHLPCAEVNVDILLLSLQLLFQTPQITRWCWWSLSVCCPSLVLAVLVIASFYWYRMYRRRKLDEWETKKPSKRKGPKGRWTVATPAPSWWTTTALTAAPRTPTTSTTTQNLCPSSWTFRWARAASQRCTKPSWDKTPRNSSKRWRLRSSPTKSMHPGKMKRTSSRTLIWSMRTSYTSWQLRRGRWRTVLADHRLSSTRKPAGVPHSTPHQLGGPAAARGLAGPGCGSFA